MKKLIALLLAIMMVASMTVAVSAAGETGAITINSVSMEDANNTLASYTLYRMLDLESYDTTSGAYSYKVNSAWTGFFATADAQSYVTVDPDSGYVTWKEGIAESAAVPFAKLALAYAKANGIASVKSTGNNDHAISNYNSDKKTASITFNGLELGWYLIDSDMGALCGLTTTNPHAYVNAKNSPPTIDKQVKEDSTQQWGDSNQADIGQTVDFRTTINVHAGAENYVLHDQMSVGLTFDATSVKVERIPSGSTTAETVAATNYNVNTAVTDGCTFEVEFTKAFCDSLGTNDKIIVYYSATLNENATVAQDGNSNEATLEFGENHTTTSDKTTTYTFGFDIIKTDSQNTLIDGAKFKIYDSATGGNEIPVVYVGEDAGWHVYRRALATETGVEIEVKAGKVCVQGFDNGTYFLEETEAPDGYNKLTARQEFTISDANLEATFTDGIFSSGSGVHVVNKTGSMLPETGAAGTMMFITFGTIAVLGAGVLLVTKKRMNMIVD